MLSVSQEQIILIKCSIKAKITMVLLFRMKIAQKIDYYSAILKKA